MRLWNRVSVIAFFGSVLGSSIEYSTDYEYSYLDYNAPCEDKAKIYEFIATSNYSINSGKV